MQESDHLLVKISVSPRAPASLASVPAPRPCGSAIRVLPRVFVRLVSTDVGGPKFENA